MPFEWLAEGWVARLCSFNAACRFDAGKRLLFSIEYRNSSCQYVENSAEWKSSDNLQHTYKNQVEANEKKNGNWTKQTYSGWAAPKKSTLFAAVARRFPYSICMYFSHMLAKYYWRRFNFVRCSMVDVVAAALCFFSFVSFASVPRSRIQLRFAQSCYNLFAFITIPDEHIIIFMFIPISSCSFHSTSLSPSFAPANRMPCSSSFFPFFILFFNKNVFTRCLPIACTVLQQC